MSKKDSEEQTEDEILIEFNISKKEIPESYKQLITNNKITKLRVIKVGHKNKYNTSLDYLVMGKINNKWDRLYGDIALLIIPYLLKIAN